MKDLVVFYSLEGNTEYVAEKIREKTGADILKLIPKKKYRDKGFSKFVWGGFSTIMAEKPELNEISTDLSQYERIIIGFPVWASSFAPPIRTFAEDNKDLLKEKRLVVYACQAGNGAIKAFEKLKGLLGVDGFERTEIFFDPKSKADPQKDEQIEAFCRSLSEG